MNPPTPHDTRALTVALTERAHPNGDSHASGAKVAATDAAWAGDLLLFLYRWFEEDGDILEENLAAWTGDGGYRVEQLLTDLDRTISLLGFQRVCD